MIWNLVLVIYPKGHGTHPPALYPFRWKREGVTLNQCSSVDSTISILNTMHYLWSLLGSSLQDLYRWGYTLFPRVETLGYYKSAPQGILASLRSKKEHGNCHHLSRVSHPWKGFANWGLWVYQKHLHITGLWAPFRVYQAYGWESFFELFDDPMPIWSTPTDDSYYVTSEIVRRLGPH